MVSSDAAPCTSGFTPYDVLIEGKPYRLWDTPGLNLASGFKLFRRKTSEIGSLKRFLRERCHCGELELLVFCVRGGRAHEAMSKAYKIFCRATRRIGIPVVIAITHLERAQPTMDAWWQENERRLGDLGLFFDGYACLTCLSPHHRRWASRRDIRASISAEYSQTKRALSALAVREYLDDPNAGCMVC